MIRPLSIAARHRGAGYVLAGLTSLSVEYTVFLLLVYVVGLPAPQANACAYLVGLGVNFTVNRHAVFRASGPAHHALSRQLTLYALLALANLIVTSALVGLLAGVVPAYVAKLAVMAVIVPGNYVLYRRHIFARAP
jgi:putative flippase GtrA